MATTQWAAASKTTGVTRQLSTLDHYLMLWIFLAMAVGGVDWPAIPAPPVAATPSLTPTLLPPDAPPPRSGVDRSNGFSLAIVIMSGMAAALVYAVIAFVRGNAFALPENLLAWLFPLLAVTGLGVALYLAYVETQSVQAVCGPVDDCNAVQSSRYARLFGVFPVGVLGAIGYIAILGAWAWSRGRAQRAASRAALAVKG